MLPLHIIYYVILNCTVDILTHGKGSISEMMFKMAVRIVQQLLYVLINLEFKKGGVIKQITNARLLLRNPRWWHTR